MPGLLLFALIARAVSGSGDLVFVEGDIRTASAMPWMAEAQLVHVESDCFLVLTREVPSGVTSWRTVEAAPVDTDRFRIMYKARCGGVIPGLPGDVVLETEDFLLIRLARSVTGPVEVPGAGILRPLRAFRESISEPVPAAGRADSILVGQIVAAVSADSITASIWHMQSYGTRYMNRPEYDACADWADTWMGTHWIPCELQTFYYAGDSMSNVVAEITGVENPDQIYIICGHLDSAASDPANAPGADDNASGSAAVIEAARVMAPYLYRNTVRFVLFAAEEAWMVGSEYYVQQAYAQGDVILGAVNLDMVLWAPGSPDSVYIPYNEQSAPLAEAAGDAFATFSPSIFPRLVYDPGAPSDHASFWQYGYSAIEVAEGSAEEIWGGYNPYYHQDTDLLLNYMPCFPYGTDVIRAAIGLVATLAEPVGPSSVEGGGLPGSRIVIASNPCISGSVDILPPEGIPAGTGFTVVDLAGRIVAEFVPDGPGGLTIDLGSLPGGIYAVACPVAGVPPARFVLLR